MHRNALAPLAALVLGLACATATAVPPVASIGPGPDAEARCARGFPSSCRDLGIAHLLGEGASQDDRLAAAYLTKTCEIGDPAGCGALAVLYALGRGVPQSDERATALSRRSCDLGFALGCSNLGALAAEGAAALPLGPDEADEGKGMKIVRMFKTACDAGTPEGCLNLGAALAGGELLSRDLSGGARAYRKACDGGIAIACQRLALIATERPDLAVDASVAALHARACRAAIASSCDAVKAPVPPASPRTPVARLVSERASFALGLPGSGGFHAGELGTGRSSRGAPDDVLRPPAALRAAVPEELRGRLGVAGAAREGEEDPAVGMLVALRRHQLGQCYESPRAAGHAATALYVTFQTDGDGKTAHVRAVSQPGDALLEACASELVVGWEFPQPTGSAGGPYLARATFDPQPPGPAPAFSSPGGLRPAPKDAGCVERTLRIPPDLRGAVGSVTVKFAVDTGGRPSLLHALTPAPEGIVAAIATAIERCGWSAGADADGRPATLWTTQTVRLEMR
jgi:TPR repeat protein